MKEFEVDCWQCERLVSSDDERSWLSIFDIFSWFESPARLVSFVDPDPDCDVCHGHGYVLHDGGGYRAVDEKIKTV